MHQHITRFFRDRFYYHAFRAIATAARRRKYRHQEDILRPVRRMRKLFLLREELDQLLECVKRVAKIPGEVAEVGVFEGGTGLILAKLKGPKHLYLFDTFEGLPEVSEADSRFFRRGQFTPSVSFSKIREPFKPFNDVHFYKGIFPNETAHHVENRRFSFVHLDVDTYQSTLACLRFFYPRMNPGGLILSHDYLIAEGVKRAFDEFYLNRPEPVIPVSGTQCMVMKTGMPSICGEALNP